MAHKGNLFQPEKRTRSGKARKAAGSGKLGRKGSGITLTGFVQACRATSALEATLAAFPVPREARS